MFAKNLFINKRHLITVLIVFSISFVSLNAHAVDVKNPRAYDASTKTTPTFEQQGAPTGSFLDRIIELFKERTIDSPKQVKQAKAIQTSLTVCPAAKAAMGFFAEWLYEFGLTQDIEATMNSLFARSNLLVPDVSEHNGFYTWTEATTYEEHCKDLEEIFGPEGAGANTIAENIGRPMTTDEMGQWMITTVMGEEWFKCDHMAGYEKYCLFQLDGISKRNSPTTLQDQVEMGMGEQSNKGAPTAPSSGANCFDDDMNNIANPFGFCSGSGSDEPDGGEDYMGTGGALSNLFQSGGAGGSGGPGGNFSCAVAICPWMYTTNGMLIDGAAPKSTVLCPIDVVKTGGGLAKVKGVPGVGPKDKDGNFTGHWADELDGGKGSGKGNKYGTVTYEVNGKEYTVNVTQDSNNGKYYKSSIIAKYGGSVNEPEDGPNKVSAQYDMNERASEYRKRKKAEAEEAETAEKKEKASRASDDKDGKEKKGTGGKAGYNPDGVYGGACGHMLRAMNESIAIICAHSYGVDVNAETDKDMTPDTGMEKAACNTTLIMREPGAMCCELKGASNMWINIIPHVTDPSPIRGKRFDPMQQGSPGRLIQPREQFKPSSDEGPGDTRQPGSDDPTR